MTWYQRLFHPRSVAGSARLEPDSTPTDAAAQFALALNYDTGAGETQDDAEAAKWYRKAAEQGYALAQFNLAVMYDQGQGVARDQVEAAKWFRKAAEQGDAGAQFQMGKRCQRDGFDAPIGNAGEAKIDAFKWFNLAAAQGYKDSEIYRERLSLVLTREEFAEGWRRSTLFLESLK